MYLLEDNSHLIVQFTFGNPIANVYEYICDPIKAALCPLKSRSLTKATKTFVFAYIFSFIGKSLEKILWVQEILESTNGWSEQCYLKLSLSLSNLFWLDFFDKSTAMGGENSIAVVGWDNVAMVRWNDVAISVWNYVAKVGWNNFTMGG